MRGLRTKLIMVMMLLVIALMGVVGSFLINSVKNFYNDRFYIQMDEVFTTDFISQLNATADSDYSKLKDMVIAQSGLGIDLTNRNAYILDSSGNYLDGTASSDILGLEITDNMMSAINGELGQERSLLSTYMDVAVPVKGSEYSYIVYIKDNKTTVDDLSSEVVYIILQSLALGLAICIILSFLLAELLITPIQSLTYSARQVAAGNFSGRLEVRSKDEIGVLTGTFNEMARVLQSTLSEIENERNKLSTLFLHMTDGVVAFSREGYVIHSNPAAEAMLQHTLNYETRYSDIFGDVVALEALLILQQPQYIGVEHKVGGRELELYLAPFSGAEAGGVLAVIHDVTAQRQTEEMRREFVANVSHELRTPLTNIKSYAETLVDSGEEIPSDLKTNFLNVILNETDRMTRIVADLLTLSRFDYSRMEIVSEEFSFEKAVSEVYEAVLLDAKKHDHEVELEIEDALPTMTGDRERILQVLMNIVSNAIKYTPNGGHILISAGKTEKTLWARVTDNGIGIPEEDQSRLFERFYRVDKARSRESGGTGLGLSIAQEIVKRHNGKIEVKSEVGEGTEITIVFPL